ncbi:unnamed protein product [Arabidopsis lyrata]|nr:unnamed protein product [Arabidopsis lyrata]
MARRRNPDKDRRTPDMDPVVWSVRVHPGRRVRIRIDRGGFVNIQRVCFTGLEEEAAADVPPADVPPADVQPFQVFFSRIRDRNVTQQLIT